MLIKVDENLFLNLNVIDTIDHLYDDKVDYCVFKWGDEEYQSFLIQKEKLRAILKTKFPEFAELKGDAINTSNIMAIDDEEVTDLHITFVSGEVLSFEDLSLKEKQEFFNLFELETVFVPERE